MGYDKYSFKQVTQLLLLYLPRNFSRNIKFYVWFMILVTNLRRVSDSNL